MKRPTFPALAVSFALSALLASGALAQTTPWKWRDAQGRFVVSDLPPPPSIADKDILERPAPPKRVAAPPPAASAVAAAAAPPLAQRSDPELDARRKKLSDEQQVQQKVQQEKEAAQRVENCARAKSHLAALGDGLRIARTNDKGEREVLDDKGRAEEMQRARTVIASDCR